jgi:hypothetical protein
VAEAAARRAGTAMADAISGATTGTGAAVNVA